MGRMLILWRGDWKKNERGYWRFVPQQRDSGLRMYMEAGQSYATMERIARCNYGIGLTTPMFFTYGLPDWMVFPSGHTPPLTIATTSDLAELMASRPWMVEFTLLVTIGAKSVAEYHFNRRSPFNIGSASFTVGNSGDETARESFQRLVSGKRMETNEEVMTEIFGEEEMMVFYRVAMEMELADKERARQVEEALLPGTEVISLLEDTDMDGTTNGVDHAAPSTRVLEGGQSSNGGGKEVSNDSVTQTKAPAILWDVGIDVLRFPEVYHRDRLAAMEASDKEFWEGVLNEETRSASGQTVGVGVEGSGAAVGTTGMLVGGEVVGIAEKAATLVGLDDVGSSSTNTFPLAPSAIVELGEKVSGSPRVAAVTRADESNEVPPPVLMLTLACGDIGENDADDKTADTEEAPTQSSQKDGGCGKG